MQNSKIPATVVAELNRQLNQELGAAHSYRALSLWCEDQNLKGFASFFAKQVTEEFAHAGKFSKHLIDRGVQPDLAAIAAPKNIFKNLLEAARHAQSLEHSNTQGINTAYEAAVTAKDYGAQVLLHWFINEQIEEEAWGLEMTERVQAANCAGGMSDLDRHIERYLEGDSAAEA